MNKELTSIKSGRTHVLTQEEYEEMVKKGLHKRYRVRDLPQIKFPVKVPLEIQVKTNKKNK